MLSSVKMVQGMDENEEFLRALKSQPENEEDEVASSSGGSRFKEILELAKQQPEPEPAFRPIMNPFLAPPQPSSPEELSVEEQARKYREMMEGGVAPKGVDLGPPAVRVSKTDRAGRPVGRNRDADSIANTSDLYFAQLKRDSSVRGLALRRGDEEEAQKVFADEGIRELENILVKNPYLQGQRDKEQNLIDTIPEEFVKSYLDGNTLSEEERNSSGVSYKEMLRQKRQKQTGGQAAAPSPQQAYVPEPVVETPPPAVQSVQSIQPPPVAMAPPQSVSAPSSSTTASNPEETKKKLRTLMGLILKHRGGPGFGRGRLKGGEIDQFENLLQEVTGLLRAEATQSGATAMGGIPLMTQPAVAPPAPAAAPVAPVNPSQMDSSVACIEGAITMYKNSPPELKSSVMVTLRAALASAINTCDGIIGVNDPTPVAASAQVDGTIAVIEGAVMMYRNSPPELQSSVVFTLRAALKSAVSTCDSLLGTPFAAAVVPAAPVVPAQPPVQPAAPVMPAQVAAPPVPAQVAVQTTSPGVPPVDVNSKSLDEIYTKLSAAAGEGSLGLRSDLSSEDASDLADLLVEMRHVLMEELEAGIPGPDEPKRDRVAAGSAQVAAGDTDGGSTVSKYQQMLAKAKAEKAAGK